jgi:predicted acetyltransferase
MITIRPATVDDVERVIALRTQAFNIDEHGRESVRKDPRVAEVRVAELDGNVVGTARALPFGHFFGGRPVEAAGISGVAVAAEARGKGVGSTMMRELVRELRRVVPISSLYPATVPIYRNIGYGFGGVRTFWKTRLDALPQSGTLQASPFTDDDVDEVNDAYERLAAGTNGLVRRSRDWWQRRVFSDWENRIVYRYLVREAGQVTGWIVYMLAKAKGEAWRMNVDVRDLMWTTPEAGRTLLSLAALHRSTGEAMSWPGPATDPLADLIAEDPIENDGTFRWMLRLLDVPGAIEARGYHPQVEASVTIAVRDPLFPENEGPWRIEVAGGQAKVFPAEQPEATAGVQALASIWSSMHRARDAVRIGGLDATTEAIDALELIFAGPLPWISDFF